eukprot:341868-Pleurochrysis_carterae.AAC.3
MPGDQSTLCRLTASQGATPATARSRFEVSGFRNISAGTKFHFKSDWSKSARRRTGYSVSHRPLSLPLNV